MVENSSNQLNPNKLNKTNKFNNNDNFNNNNKFNNNNNNKLNNNVVGNIELLAMINKYQELNKIKVYRDISLSDININTKQKENVTKKDNEKIVKNKLQGEYGEKKFIKP